MIKYDKLHCISREFNIANTEKVFDGQSLGFSFRKIFKLTENIFKQNLIS